MERKLFQTAETRVIPHRERFRPRQVVNSQGSDVLTEKRKTII